MLFDNLQHAHAVWTMQAALFSAQVEAYQYTWYVVGASLKRMGNIFVSRLEARASGSRHIARGSCPGLRVIKIHDTVTEAALLLHAVKDTAKI